jgi:hypothetical protein
MMQGKEPEVTEGRRRNIRFCAYGLPPLFQAVPRSSTPRVLRIAASETPDTAVTRSTRS